MTPRARGSGLLAVLAMTLLGCGDDGITVPEDDPLEYGGGEFEQAILSGDQRRGYLVVVPPSARPETPAPLLLVYHGRPQSVESIRAVSDMDRVAGDRGWIVVYPRAVAVSQGWAVADGLPPATNGQDDVLFTHDIIRAVSEELNVDLDRVYATGFSNGSQMVMRLACQLGDELAAVAPVAGTITARIAHGCSWPRPLPLVTFLGDEDRQFPWRGADVGFDVVVSGEETAAWYAERNACTDPRDDTELPDTADDGTTVTRWTWDDCGGDAEVRFHAIFGGGHTWPGSPVTFDPGIFGRTSREISASEIIVEFFADRAP